MSSDAGRRHLDMEPATLTDLLTVTIPSTDLDRSRALFEQLGFQVRMDAELQPGFRWIELDPPAGGCALSLVASGDALPVGIDTGIRFGTADAADAHRRCSELGLEVGELLDWDTAPLMFTFTDPDGNRFYVTETSSD